MRHKWEKVTAHKAVCVKCGVVKLHIPSFGFHRTQFERAGTFWEQKTPPCDAKWPKGWKPDRAQDRENNQGKEL